MSQDGVHTDDRKVEAVRKWTVSHMVTEACSFVGFPNYYRRFLKGYVTVASPLHALISGENMGKKNKPVVWMNACQAAFN